MNRIAPNNKIVAVEMLPLYKVNPRRQRKPTYSSVGRDYKKIKPVKAKIVRVVKRSQECTLRAAPLCLGRFITNQESTICLRCQNVRV